MTQNSSDDFAEIRDLWVAVCAVYASKGIDMPRFVRFAARRKKESVSTQGCERDFEELCCSGCSEVSLALALWLLESSRRWSNIWKTAIGLKRRRQQASDVLERAASVLEELEASVESAVFEDMERSYSEKLQQPTQTTVSSFSYDPGSNWPAAAPAPHPKTVIRALRLYSRLLHAFENISDEAGINSPESLAKYLISAYVRKTTGKFHDPQVSALIGSSFNESYDETAHRMWRSRNYAQIDESSSTLVKLLLGIGVVIDSEP